MVVASAAALATAAPAFALVGAGASEIDKAVQGLRSSPVYVDPHSANVLSRQDATRVASEIETRNAGPMYVVVLPGAAADAVGGDPVGVLREIQSQLGRPGVYAGIKGAKLKRKNSTPGQVKAAGFPRVRVAQAARHASAVKHGKAAAVLGAVGAAGLGGAAVAHHGRKNSWQSYGKRDTSSAFGIDHE